LVVLVFGYGLYLQYLRKDHYKNQIKGLSVSFRERITLVDIRYEIEPDHLGNLKDHNLSP